MTDIKFSNPLLWKDHIKPTLNRKKSSFKAHTVFKSCKMLAQQLTRMKAKDCIITSNIPTNTNGFISAKNIGLNPGCSVYFKLNGMQKVIQVDSYLGADENLYAVAKSVEAIRNLDRWGGAQVMDGVFSGFAALPSPETVTTVAMIYYFDGFNSKASARAQYLDWCKKLHPDNGGDATDFQEMKRQYEALK